MDWTTLFSSITPAIITGIISYLASIRKSKADIEALKLTHKNEIEKLQLLHKTEIEKLKTTAELKSNNTLNDSMAKAMPEIMTKVFTGEISLEKLNKLKKYKR